MSIYRQAWAFLKKIVHKKQGYNSDTVVVPPLQQEDQPEEEEPEEEEEAEIPQESEVPPQPQNVTEDFVAIWKILTPREREVVALICIGFKDFHIGRLLSITEATAKVHARHIRKKFSISNRGKLKAILQPMENEFEDWARKRFGDDLIDRWKLWGQLDI